MKYTTQAEMPFAPKEDCYSLLEPFFDVFRESFLTAWQRWLKTSSENPEYDSTARARCVANVACAEIKRRFQGIEGASVIEQGGGGLSILNYRDKAILRFKKLTDNLETRNIPTRRQTLFALQLRLPGFPDAPRLVVGYVLNKLQTDIKDIVIVYAIGKVVQWHISILDAGEGESGITPFVTTLPPAPIQSSRKPTFVKKNEA